LKRKVPIKFDLYMNSITFTKENYGYEASSTIVIINSYLQFMTGSYCSLSLSLSLSIYIYICICMYVYPCVIYSRWSMYDGYGLNQRHGCWVGKDSTEYILQRSKREDRSQSIQLLHEAHFFRLAPCYRD